MATAAEAARHLFLGRRWFHDLVDRGVIDRAPRGGYDLDRVRQQYIEHMVSLGEAGDAPPRPRAEAVDTAAALKMENLRLARAKADAEERKNKEATGELLPRQDVHIAVAGAFALVRQKMLALPTRTAPLVLGLNRAADVKQKIEAGIHEALGELPDENEMVGTPPQN